MRKIHPFFLILLIAFALVACSEGSETEQTDEPATVIQVTNNSDSQITSIEIKLYQNDMVQASPTAMNTDESLIVMGEGVEFEILTQDLDFEEQVVIEAVAMINGVEVSAGQTEPIEFVPGETYRFEITGDSELQFRESVE